MEIGVTVILQKPLGPCLPGAQGIIRNIDGEGRVVVEITHDHECNPFTFLLPPATPDHYVVGSNCS